MKKTNRNVNPRARRTGAGARTSRPHSKPTSAPAQPAECLVAATAGGRGEFETTVASSGRLYGGCDPLLDFSLLRLPVRGRHAELTDREMVWVLLSGRVTFSAGGRVVTAERRSLFDEGPMSLHCGAGEPVAIEAIHGPAELAVAKTENPGLRGVVWSMPADCATEDRGAGLVQGACRRLVRTIFDYSTRPESNLVVGEVVNFPGRWSSYPPHHHPQPEIYHYRFTEPQGYGHAELGDAVLKVRHGDTTVIPGGLDHAQVSAPGYGMYYLWIVRHLPGKPYQGFTFTREHTWLLDPKHQGWQPTAPST